MLLFNIYTMQTVRTPRLLDDSRKKMFKNILAPLSASASANMKVKPAFVQFSIKAFEIYIITFMEHILV